MTSPNTQALVRDLPDGRDSRSDLARLAELEAQAKTARRGAWGKVQP
jgi:hypothetical protein